MKTIMLAHPPEVRPVPSPDPEVTELARRRQFSAEYKRRIVREADACTEPGAVGALLRREGLYSSHLTEWRRVIREAETNALVPQKRGPKAKVDPAAIENARLRRENELLKAELRKAEVIIDVQKKLSELLGIPLDVQQQGETK